jgi:hypothetical protein
MEKLIDSWDAGEQAGFAEVLREAAQPQQRGTSHHWGQTGRLGQVSGGFS